MRSNEENKSHVECVGWDESSVMKAKGPLRKDLKQVGSSDTWERGVPSRGNSRCKGPGAVCLGCVRNGEVRLEGSEAG